MKPAGNNPPQSAQKVSRGQRRLMLLSGLLLGGFFLYITARNIDLDEVLAILYSIDKRWILPLSGTLFLSIFMRTVRWRLMFPDSNRPAMRPTFDALMIGKLGNNFMPGRLGELLRVSFIGKLVPDVGASGALATVIIEKIFDSLAILLFMGIALLLIPLPSWMVNSGLMALGVFLFLLLALWILNRTGGRISNAFSVDTVAAPVAKVLEFAGALLRKFSSGLFALQHAGHFALLGGLTLLIWTQEIVMFLILFQVFDISLPILAALVCVVFLCVGLMLPAAPGFIGTYQLFIVAALKLFEVPDSTAFALAVFLNLFAFVLTSAIAILAIVVDGGLINLRQAINSLK